MRAYHEDVHPACPVYPTRITRALVEEFTGEPFDYEEILPAYGGRYKQLSQFGGQLIPQLLA